MSGLVCGLGLAALLAAPSAADPVTDARRVLAATADFDPIKYVKAGRKGEVVEDEFLAAREEYRRHRSKLYEAAGDAYLEVGKNAEALRYFRRALDLDPKGSAAPKLARALVAAGRSREALDVLLASGKGDLSAATLAALSEAADAAGIPSLQAEIDRARALALLPKPEFRDGPIRFPDRARLSTGQPLRFEGDGLTLLYVGDEGCRTCSADLEAVKRAAPATARVILMAGVTDRDQALRSVATLYRYPWPYAVGTGTAGALKLPAPSLLVVGRRGWSAIVVTPPFTTNLPAILDLMGKSDVLETLPHATWNHTPIERPALKHPPSLLASGLAPGEDDPFPEPFTAAVAAFDGGRPAEALPLIEQLEADGGWLLGPEARLNRALCLAALGRREEARKLLLRTGDSRFQDAVDRTLERIGSPRKP